KIARNMVTKWGLSERLGPLSFDEDDGEVFLGRSVTQHKQYSDETAHAIDEEVSTLINRTYKRAREILTAERDKLDTMAKALIKYETIDSEQIADIMAGREPRPPSDWTDPGDPSDQAPAATGKTGNDGERKPGKPIGGPASEH